jgi:mono/diheme cytochrome c family protein
MVCLVRSGTATLCVFLAVASGTAQEPTTSEESVRRGKALVVQNCSGCHAVGITGDSSHPTAPPFRRLSERFPIDALEETFVDSIDTGHPGMPVFQATQQQINDIIDYIASVME